MTYLEYIYKKIVEKMISKYHIYNYKYTNVGDKNSLKVWWYTGLNFGDNINYYLLKSLTNKKVTWVERNTFNHPYYIVIGSTVACATKYSIIWGAGFISENDYSNEKPLKVCAVRGPKTREKLLAQNIECPEVYGDPALLLPRVYYPEIKKKYKIGIIPHYVDKDNMWLETIKNMKDVLIIDIQRINPLSFIDDLLSCERIASTSLHGIITADAYEIPSLWLKMSDKLDGGDFKFIDYFMSVGRKEREAFDITKETLLDEIYQEFYDYKIDIDLDKLLESCPFNIAHTVKS